MKSLMVIYVQVAICIMIIIFCFTIKFIGGEVYEKTRSFYYESLENSITMTVFAPTVE